MKFKKIATVLGSALMVGSTLGLAAAAAYPTPFVQNGVANVAIVVGTAGAEASDMVAATDISADLAKDLSAQAVGGVVTVTGGDSYKFEDVSDNLNVGDSLATFASSLNDEDMSNFLASGKYKDTNRTEFDFDQTISVAGANVSFFADTNYDNKAPTLGVHYDRNAPVLNYTIDFNGPTSLAQYVDTDLPLMGKMYYVLSATSNSLTLLDSSASTTLSEGETTTLDIDGTSYEVSVDYISSAADPEVKLVVNGETTDKLVGGDSYELDNGAYIAAKEVLYSAKESGVSKVEFTIGKGKLELIDGNEVQMNDNNVQGLTADLSDESTITIVWTADEEAFLAGNSEVLTMPGFETIKLVWSGIEFPSAEMTVLDASDVMYLDTQVKDGALSLPLFEYASSGNFSTQLGTVDDALVTNATASPIINLTIGDMFVATYISTDKKDYATYAYELQSVNNDTSTGKTEVVLHNIAGGDDITFSEIGRDRTKGKIRFNLTNAYDVSSQAEWATIQLLPLSSAEVNASTVITDKGLLMTLPLSSAVLTDGNLTTWTMNFTELNKDGEARSGETLNATISTDVADEAIHVSAVGLPDGDQQETKTNDVYEGYVYSPLATMYKWDKSGDSNDFEVSYFGEEVIADVQLASTDAIVSTGNAVLGTITVLDSEASKMSGKNLIVVGGNCVNSVAASLLGLSAGANCMADFSAKTDVANGGYLIQSFSKDGQVALLVAGYSAADTTKAKTYLVNNNVETSVGTKLKGTSATEATVVTA